MVYYLNWNLFLLAVFNKGIQMKKVHVEVCHNQAGGLSLCISGETSGHRIFGAKVGGCQTLKTFTVDAEELISQIKLYAFKEKGNEN